MKRLAIFLSALAILTLGLFMPLSVFAQAGGAKGAAAGADPFADGIGVCDFIGPICDAIGLDTSSPEEAGINAQQFVRARLQLILSLVFVGIILLAVVIIIQAGVKYIQSQGDEGKIAESTKAIKSVFIGIGILFVGIVGIVLVLMFFGGLGLLAPGTQNSNDTCYFDENGILTCPNPEEISN